jgi:hypothetical protein
MRITIKYNQHSAGINDLELMPRRRGFNVKNKHQFNSRKETNYFLDAELAFSKC